MDHEVWEWFCDPFRREVEIVEWIRDFEGGEKEERPEYEVSEWGVSRWPTGICSTKVEPGPDSDEGKDEAKYIEGEFPHPCRCKKIADVSSRPQSDGTEEDDQPFTCLRMLYLPCLWNSRHAGYRR
ncbi:hypothetical protein JCM31271_34040 [Halorubrum trueperi]